jgi:4-hydroxyphenylpyruvate dioxygenase-like putative hemolysin
MLPSTLPRIVAMVERWNGTQGWGAKYRRIVEMFERKQFRPGVTDLRPRPKGMW